MIGERLMVHPTSVTNTIDRLERQQAGDPQAEPPPTAGAVLAEIHRRAGRDVVEAGHPGP